jgi:hypothetical protein
MAVGVPPFRNLRRELASTPFCLFPGEAYVSFRYPNLSSVRAAALPAVLFPVLSIVFAASAATLCVNPGGKAGCTSSIGAAVAAAAPGDIIQVAEGTYKEDVLITKSLSLKIIYFTKVICLRSLGSWKR